MFDDQNGDVVHAVAVPHELVDEQVGELIRGDMLGEPGEDRSHLADADVEGSVATLDQPVGEHHELGAERKRRNVGDTACRRVADDRCVGGVEPSDLPAGKSQDGRGMTGGRERDRRSGHVDDCECSSSEKQPGTFDRAAFIAAVREAIDAAAPKNLEEADEFKEGGAEKVKGQVGGLVKEGKQSSEKDIKDATVETPDGSKAKPKPVQPMPEEPKGAAQATVGAEPGA